MLGTIYEWFYAGVLGLKPEGEAYKTWIVSPPFGSEFGRVQGRVECPYGWIEIEWVMAEKGGARMMVNVPTSTTGYLVLEREREVRLKRMGEREYEVVRGKRVALRPGKWAVKVML